MNEDDEIQSSKILLEARARGREKDLFIVIVLLMVISVVFLSLILGELQK